MVGTVLNCAAILVGGAAGLGRRRSLSPRLQSQIKVWLGAGTAYIGLKMIWNSIRGGFSGVLRDLVLLWISLVLGKIIGGLLHLQRSTNSLGRFAREEMEAAGADGANPPSRGLKVCAALFCAAPLALLGPLQEALDDNLYPLVVKSLLDGLAAFAFAGLFGWGTLLSALPVAALQGSIWLAARGLEPSLRAHALTDPIIAASGFLVFCAALIILEIRKVRVADYLPSLILAPLLAFAWK
jgi:uncharacterized membrane protein YqgA involved in biofilm formation